MSIVSVEARLDGTRINPKINTIELLSEYASSLYSKMRVREEISRPDLTEAFSKTFILGL